MKKNRWKVFPAGIWIACAVCGMASGLQAAQSPNAPTGALSQADEPSETRTVRLKVADAEEARIVLLGTLAAGDPGRLHVEIDSDRRTLHFSGREAIVNQAADLMPALDQPTQEIILQRRLFEMWIRLNNAMLERKPSAP